jgi:ribonuclease HII
VSKSTITNQPTVEQDEWQRLQELVLFEKEARLKGFKLIAGIDEAGRGPLAGPVVAAVCILPKNLFIPDIDDSKKLTPKKRCELFEFLVNHKKIHYGIGILSSVKIDEINIYQATVQAMLQAVNRLTVAPDLLLVDGMQIPHETIPSQKIIKGDQKSQSIAAASIIAKETRDRLMREYDRIWPDYGFLQHKGYGTEMHLKALALHGPCPIHRRSFDPIKSMIAPVESQLLMF